jgi:hypothetical protein
MPKVTQSKKLATPTFTSIIPLEELKATDLKLSKLGVINYGKLARPSFTCKLATVISTEDRFPSPSGKTRSIFVKLPDDAVTNVSGIQFDRETEFNPLVKPGESGMNITFTSKTRFFNSDGQELPASSLEDIPVGDHDVVNFRGFMTFWENGTKCGINFIVTQFKIVAEGEDEVDAQCTI